MQRAVATEYPKWDWDNGLQREETLCYIDIANCVVMGGRHSFLTAPCGIGSLDCRGKERCITMRSQAVLSRVGDTLFKQLLMGLEA